MSARNLTPAFATTDCEGEARKWRLTDLAHQCIFCGSDKVEATLVAPAGAGPPAMLNIGVCGTAWSNRVDPLRAVKNQRLAQVARTWPMRLARSGTPAAGLVMSATSGTAMAHGRSIQMWRARRRGKFS